MSTVDRVQAAVMSDMLRGSLPPGTWMRQDDIAERLGVSKIPVREALQRLAVIGLVRFEANRGAVVPELSASEAEENYVLRHAIELRLLGRALPLMSIVDLAAAELALIAAAPLTESNWNFHRALYAASGWKRGLAIAEILHAAVAPYVLLYTEGLGGAAASDAEHLALLELCRKGDVAGATDLLSQHLQTAEFSLINWFSSRSESSPRGLE